MNESAIWIPVNFNALHTDWTCKPVVVVFHRWQTPTKTRLSSGLKTTGCCPGWSTTSLQASAHSPSNGYLNRSYGSFSDWNPHRLRPTRTGYRGRRRFLQSCRVGQKRRGCQRLKFTGRRWDTTQLSSFLQVELSKDIPPVSSPPTIDIYMHYPIF